MTNNGEDHLKLVLQRVQKSSSHSWTSVAQHYRHWPCHTPPSPPHIDEPWPNIRASVTVPKNKHKSRKFGGHSTLPSYVRDEPQVDDLRFSDLVTSSPKLLHSRMAGISPEPIEEVDDEESEEEVGENKPEGSSFPSIHAASTTSAGERFFDPMFCTPSSSRSSLASVASLASIPEEVLVRNVATQTPWKDYRLVVHQEKPDEKDTHVLQVEESDIRLLPSSKVKPEEKDTQEVQAEEHDIRLLSSSELQRLLCPRSTQTDFPELSSKSTYVLRSEGSDTQDCESLNFLQAFGRAKKEVPKYEEKYKVVIEMEKNGITKRYLIPRKYAAIGKWVFFGTRVYIFRGHSFLTHKAQPAILKLCCCLGTDFRDIYEYFYCRDCNFRCNKINPDAVKDYCPSSSLDDQEMEFPYDSTHIRSA